MEKGEKKVEPKEEELRRKEEDLGKAQAKITPLKREFARSRDVVAEVLILKAQLEAA